MTQRNFSQQGGIRGEQSFPSAFVHALEGICHAWRSERNMKIHFTFTVAVLLWNLSVRPTLGQVTATVAACSFVIGMELLNTAVERLVDLATDGALHHLAKQAKDAAAGAVVLSGCAALAVAAFVLQATLPWQWRLFSNVHWSGAVESAVGLCLIFFIMIFAKRRH